MMSYFLNDISWHEYLTYIVEKNITLQSYKLNAQRFYYFYLLFLF